jgi:hypothetical protein
MDNIIFILHRITPDTTGTRAVGHLAHGSDIKAGSGVDREITCDLRYGENDYFVDGELYCIIV